MNDVRELVRAATDPVLPPPTDVLVRGVSRRLHRRRVVRACAASLAALAVLAGVSFVARQHHDHAAPPATPADTTLPAGHAVGTGVRVGGWCAGSSCWPVLTTADGQRYRLPTSPATRAEWRNGTRLSPDGRWVSYVRRGAVELRDLAGTRLIRVPESGVLGAPSAWSSNGRWVVVTGAPIVRGHGLTRVDLRTGRMDAFDPAAVPGAHLWRGNQDPSGVLPSGEVAFGAPGAAPPGTPGRQRWRPGPGVYRMVDPRAGRVTRTVHVDDAVTWGAQRHGGRRVWGDAGDSVSRLAVSPDGRRAALTGQVDGGPLVRIVDLATGHVVHTVGLSHSVPVGDDHHVVVSLWLVTRFTATRVTVVGYDGGPVVHVSIDPAAGKSLAGTTTRYPVGTVLPGAPL